MLDSRPEDLIRAKKLIYEANFNEALEIIDNFEEKGTKCSFFCINNYIFL